ncbi:septum formation family protein [Asanoa sp. WMMD1127]|uniref:septum formation family protein n=1 Tax=Asanoa sp. WMMD1127 TaxID=3016107 RepID=UPI002415FC77|nr:septum formation family protein [Asanoa sp. WMMD1127]MDG4827292.1 septum formation family protein [Asanoa sp. WMMD1127]
MSQPSPPPAPARGLLVFGVLFAVVIVVAAVVGAAVALGNAGDSASGGEVSAAKLAVGHCVDGLKETDDLAGLPVLPCEQPHEGEVFAIFALPAGPYPGDAALGRQAQQECLKRFETYAPSSVADDKVELFYLHPSQLSWTSGDRGVTCVATDPTAKRTGSLKG